MRAIIKKFAKLLALSGMFNYLLAMTDTKKQGYE